MPHPNNGKNQLDIQKQNFKLNFSRKIHKQFLETHQTLKILDVAISSHLIFFFFWFCSFPDTSKQLRRTKIGRFEAEKLAVTGERGVFRLSQKDKLSEPIKKNPYYVINTAEPVSATMSMTLLW